MSVLETIYASGGDVIINTIELACPAWADSIFICNGFENHVCTDEDEREITFIAAGIAIALPKKNNTGAQTLTFAIDLYGSTVGDGPSAMYANELINQALEDEERIILTYRAFLASDKSTPAETPYRMTVLSGEMQGTVIQIQAGFFDLLNTAWPRDKYTATFAPGLRYL